ncbi:MAG TPA: sulfatase-like hydrolase/transferase [Puia sp.]|nr:sulfatase-like hydrolase/transferase [Puia sp.]
MKRIFQEVAVYVFLMPVFFVLHGFVENFGFIGIGETLLLMLTYGGVSALLYFIFLALYKEHIKAALLSSYIMGFYLFFGAIHDFFKDHNIPLHKYSIIIPLFFVFLLFGLIYLKKIKKPFSRSTLFLNLLFFIYLVIDICGIAWKVSHPNPNRLSTYAFANTNTYKVCDSCNKPDIYLLLFDEYGSSLSLKQRFNFDNSNLDSFLVDRGFHIQTRSRSNYNFTPFSMASILNMSYLQGIKNTSACTLEDYAYCDNLVKDDEVIKYLSYQGYDIVNYSVFDLAGNPSKVEQTFLPLKTKLITDRTFWRYFQKDIGWLLFEGRFKIKWLVEQTMFKHSNNNNTLVGMMKNESALQSNKPRFIYGHFYMPHPPFFYDKIGNKRDVKTVYEQNDEKFYQAYLDYIPYTNQKAKEIINTIQQNTNNSAVIIFLGDHGFRHTTDTADLSNYFQNQNAVYFPDKEYHSFYDSVSTVNEFRLVFNKLFNAGFPILKDSSIFLTDKK